MGAMLALVLLGTAPGARSPAAAQRGTAVAPPAPVRSPQNSQEIRALWVLRGSLTRPDRIDRLVTTAARSGFNTLLLQVRGRGDAYYDSAIEPRGTISHSGCALTTWVGLVGIIAVLATRFVLNQTWTRRPDLSAAAIA